MAALYDFMGSGVPNLPALTDPQKCPTCWERLRSTRPEREPVTCRSSYLKRLTATRRWIRRGVSSRPRTTTCRDGKSRGNATSM